MAVAFLASPDARAQYDRCEDAVISSLIMGGFLNGATIDGSASCQVTPQPDLWWSYRPQSSGLLTLRACGSNTPQGPVNPLLSVHSGCPGTTVNELGCNDDGINPGCSWPIGSELTVPVTGGALYFVRISTPDGLAGSVAPQVMSGPPATPSSNSIWQTACAVSPGLIHGNTFHGYWAWFSYTPATSGTAVAETCGLTQDDTMLFLRQGPIQLGGGDDNCSYQSRITWSAVAGIEYQIGHTFFPPDYETFFSMRLTGPPSAEDDCASAPILGEGVRWMSFENAVASGSSNCDVATLPTRWYRYVAPSAGTLTVSTLGTDDGLFPDAGEDTAVSLHHGCPATPANQIACNDTAAAASGQDSGALADAAISTAVTSGQWIVIRVTRAGTAPPDSNIPARLNVSFASLEVPVCAGDGSAAPCPCANSGANGHGCANSQDAGGAHLTATGAAHLSSDTFDLHGTNMPASGTALYVQGTAASAGGAGVLFGDGLRCVSGTVLRLGVRTNTNGQSSLGFGDGTHVSTAGQIPPGGGTRIYQVWYRDAVAFCTTAPFNLSNGLSIPWGP